MSVLAWIAGAQAAAKSFSTLHTIQVRWDQDGDHFTPIVSDDDGNLYYAFVNGSDKLVIGMKPPNGSAQETTVVPLYTATDQFHATPSIGIDQKGFLHVVGPMHNTDMDYLISNRPYSVTSGFTRQKESNPTDDFDGRMRGLWLGYGGSSYNKHQRWITYPYMFYGRNSDLWISYRSRVGTSGWQPGTQAGQLAKYNASSRLWQPVGGSSNTDYKDIPGNPAPKPNCFVWSKHADRPAGGHQGPSAKPFADKNGRLHYVFKHERDTGSSSWVQDMLYWFSDDDGASWHFANGAAIKDKPIVVIDGHPPIMWAHGPTGDNDMYGGFGSTRLSDGAPVVSYVRRTNGGGKARVKFAVFEGTSWKEYDTGGEWFPGRLIIDTHDIWYVLRGRYVYVSADNGSSWKTYDSRIANANGQNANFDVRYFMKTNKIRYVAKPAGTGSGTQTASIVEFVSDEWKAPRVERPAAPKGLNVSRRDEFGAS